MARLRECEIIVSASREIVICGAHLWSAPAEFYGWDSSSKFLLCRSRCRRIDPPRFCASKQSFLESTPPIDAQRKPFEFVVDAESTPRDSALPQGFGVDASHRRVGRKLSEFLRKTLGMARRDFLAFSIDRCGLSVIYLIFRKPLRKSPRDLLMT